MSRAVVLPAIASLVAAAAFFACSVDEEEPSADAPFEAPEEAETHEEPGPSGTDPDETTDPTPTADAGGGMGGDAAPDGGPPAEVFSARCELPAPADYAYKANQSYFGKNKYIEYVPGTYPVILSAPHGGDKAPAAIPIQPDVKPARDGGSLETTLLVQSNIKKKTGRAPHVIINHLTRNRLNANRTKDEASGGNPQAANAWEEFHVYIEAAKAWVTSACGRGHYIDMHTNGHAEGWNEMGFALTGAELDLSNKELDTPARRKKSTVRALVTPPSVSFIEVLRGPTSLGGLLDAAGVKAVPSPRYPGPKGGGFFSGGYNVRRHGSRDGGVIDGTQIENSYKYVNSGVKTREEYAAKLADAIIAFVRAHYGFTI